MKAKYSVEFNFSGKLTDNQKDEIVERVLNALVHEANTAGIVPDDAEEYTTAIIVSREENNISLGKDLINNCFI